MYLVSSSNSHTLTKEFIERLNNSEYHCMQSTRNRQNHFSLDFKDATIELLKHQELKTLLLLKIWLNSKLRGINFPKKRVIFLFLGPQSESELASRRTVKGKLRELPTNRRK